MPYVLRIRQEVERLISGSLVTGVEVRHDSDMLSKRFLDHLAGESQRVVELAAASDRALVEEVTTAAGEALAAAEREMGVLSLEAQALSGRVSSAMQEKLDVAAEDMLEAERRQNNHLNFRGDSAGEEDKSDDVASDGSAQSHQPESS